MTGYKLPENYVENLEALLRKKWSHATSSAIPPTVKPVTPTPSTTTVMANKSLHEYSIPAVNTDIENFKLKTGLITIVQANPFYGLPSEDTNAHLRTLS